MKTVLRRALIGFVIGMAVGNLIAALTGHSSLVSEKLLTRTGSLSAALLTQTLLSGVIGAAGMGGTALYEIDRLPLLVIDLAHYALVLAVFLPSGYYLGWFPTAGVVLAMAGIMFAVHFSVFLIMCAIYRRQVKELNELQKEYRSRENEKNK